MENKHVKSQCVSAAVAIFGDKWTPILIRVLMDTTLRFSQIQEKAGGINPRTLSERLTRLEEEGIVKKVIFPEVPPRTEYTLTKKGEDLIPILESMSEWGEKYPKNNL
ncbi:MAG TPA: helix-turn-helix domain-containing protein [Candidatus Saccharimonadales bacterium]|nr:helix-turn-helix domain-containing protein [Candidatus Saccharimonadales bacterium]